jgi:hypothetical protein
VAKSGRHSLSVTPEPLQPGVEGDESPTAESGELQSERAERGKIRLSIDLPAELHFCLAGIAADEGQSLKAFALRLLDQSRRRYASNAILQSAYEQMRSKRRKAG